MANLSIQEATGKFAVGPEQVLFKPLLEGGVGPNREMTGDYSIVPSTFSAQAPAGQQWYLNSIVFFIKGPGNLHANNYGPIAPLANGVVLTARDAAGGPIAALPDLVLQSSGDISALGATSESNSLGPGDVYVSYRWSWQETVTAIVLPPGYSIVVNVSDDLSTLTNHRATLEGYVLMTPP